MKAMPHPLEFLLESPLYRRFKRDDSAISKLRDFLGPIDAHCHHCNDLSVFAREDQTPSQAMAGYIPVPGDAPFASREFKPYEFSMQFMCSRDSDHKLYFNFRVGEESITKFGEYPSRVDRFHPELEKFAKPLGTYHGEFRSALMLQSHGFGIGSFIYLRRVFEHVLRDLAIRKYEEDSSWAYDEWRKDKRVEDVIDDLSDALPDFLLNNKSLYVILSKGIHELDEDECLAVFPIVKSATEEILDDVLLGQQKEKRRKAVTKQIKDLRSKLGRS